MKGNLILKILFVVAAIAGVALVFVVSWFWTLLLIPMVVIMFWDIASDFYKKKRK